MPDQPDFAEFVAESYAGLLRRAFLLVGGDHGRAEDLVQTALTSAYVRWRRVREPHAYLRTVMIRTSVSWRRRRWAGEIPTDRLPESPATRVDGADVATAETVRRALLTLPPDQRAVIVLRYFDDCSEAETAHVLRCPVGTVKSRAARALATLRESGLFAEEGQIR